MKACFERIIVFNKNRGIYNIHIIINFSYFQMRYDGRSLVHVYILKYFFTHCELMINQMLTNPFETICYSPLTRSFRVKIDIRFKLK